MRLTLWQQFSSNHSASFFVVGKFQSAKKAEQVAEELRTIIRKVYTWWRQLDAEKFHEWALRIYHGELTSVEIELAEHYAVEWSTRIYGGGDDKGEPHGIDYLVYDPDAEKVAQHHVSLFEDRVMVRSHEDTEVNSAPFRQLMERYGGKVANLEGDGIAHFPLYITAIAPDETEAQQLMTEVFYRPRREVKHENSTIIYFEELKVNGIDLMYKPVRAANQVLYTIDAYLEDTPWEYVVKMRTYLTARGCKMDYYFEGEIPPSVKTDG